VQAEVNIETVLVGNPGNAPDTRYALPGYGSVSYEYKIGKYEVTSGQYTEFLNKVAGVDTYGLYSTYMWSDPQGCKIERYAGSGTGSNPYQYRVAADYANRPVNCVSWGDSARFANWLHNGQPSGAQDLTTTEDGAYYLNGATTDAQLLAVTREADCMWAITSEHEWYKAAYYNSGSSSYYDYPTSTNSMPGRDMTETTNPGNNANYYDVATYPIDPPYYTTVAGEFELSDSPYDTFDQGGNVWEWTEAISSDSARVLHGGSFDSYYGALVAPYRIGINPAGEVCTSGFRVAYVPEPATLGLAGLGGLAVIRRRGR
jgi:formylglycine-generating enzyme required for sulfatase activity